MITFELLLFITMDILFKDFILAAVITLVTARVSRSSFVSVDLTFFFQTLRQVCETVARRNLASKALIDDRFLI